MGAVREVAVGDRAEAVAQAYVESKSHDVLVVCATHEEIDRVTEAIRANRNKMAAWVSPCKWSVMFR